MDPTGRNKLRVEIVDSTAALNQLAAEWNPLLQTSQSNNLFLTWEWIWTWWQVYGNGSTPHVLVARDDDGRLVGLAPLKRTRKYALGVWPFNTVDFIGAGGDVTPEYLDLISAPGLEAPVVDGVVSRLRTDRSVSMVDLRPIPALSPHLSPLKRHFRNDAASVRVSSDSVCPTMRLPASQQEFLATRSHNYKKKIGEYERRLVRDLGARLRISGNPTELARDYQSLIELHRRRWNGNTKAFRSSSYVSFHERLSQRLLERGWLRLFILENATATEPMAALYCFSYDERYYYYQGGWDPKYARYRVGLVLMHKVIQQAILEHARVFDFLRGQEEYKGRWATDRVAHVRLTEWRNIGTRTTAGLHEVMQRGFKRGRSALLSYRSLPNPSINRVPQ
jgi:CelD/BcsL family acetyltransferase involved in cellulose biosynthesis